MLYSAQLAIIDVLVLDACDGVVVDVVLAHVLRKTKVDRAVVIKRLEAMVFSGFVTKKDSHFTLTDKGRQVGSESCRALAEVVCLQ